MLTCTSCQTSYPATEARWRCDCGHHLHHDSQLFFSKDSLSTRPANLWRYFEAYGIAEEKNIVSLGEGFTPLIPERLYDRQVFLKMDQLNPTGSFKDRGTAVMLSKLKEWGIEKLVEDSSGNAGASVAAYSARAGIKADIYIPHYTSAGKAAQIAFYGGNLVKVPGTRADTSDAVLKAAESGIYYASHNWNPYFVNGLRSAAYEMAEQLDWQAPDWVITPLGGGSLFLGLAAGWQEMFVRGYVDKVPRLVAVQAENCAPVYHAWRKGLSTVPAITPLPTAAEGISIPEPVKGDDIMDALKLHDGLVVTVSEEEIWTTLPELAARGVYVEPTSAAAPAALKQMIKAGFIATSDRVVVELTGMGLKATDKILAHYNLLD